MYHNSHLQLKPAYGSFSTSAFTRAIFARQQDPGRADALLDETAQAVQKASGWHAWK